MRLCLVAHDKMAAMGRSPLLLGHRGALRYAPENTIAAFDLALEHRCDGFEFDVRLTADGVAVVCHDPAIHGYSVAETRFATLQDAAEGSMPTLKEVWDRYCQRAFMNIELKVPGIEHQVVDLYAASPATHGSFVSSFLPEVVRDLHARHVGIPLGYICKNPAKLGLWAALPVEYVVLHRTLIRDSLAEEIALAEKQLIVWTVNDEREMLHLASLGVHGIISDDTRHLRRVLRPDPLTAQA
jgi:glycerophosphoryl diester phosphodiesterase